MKLHIITILIVLLCASVGINAQGTSGKKEKKQKKRDRPTLTVVEVQEKPILTPPVIAQKPANGSLFTDNSANGNLLRDFKASRVGDLVFVDVVETNTASVTSNATRKRDSGNEAGLVPLVTALPIGPAPVIGAVMGELGQRKFDGKGTTARSSTVKARITARVVEVLSNGDMRIEAVKMVKINGETEQLAVTGIIRPNDLARDNSIETLFVGDLRVEFNGKGIASADNAPGWLFRLFDKISPF